MLSKPPYGTDAIMAVGRCGLELPALHVASAASVARTDKTQAFHWTSAALSVARLSGVPGGQGGSDLGCCMGGQSCLHPLVAVKLNHCWRVCDTCRSADCHCNAA